MRLLLPLILVALSGCVAEMVEKKKPRKGPVPEVGFVEIGGGEVRYSSEGWGFIVWTRKVTAQRKMRRTCKGLNVKIVDEFTHEDVEVPYSNEDLDVNMERGMEHYSVAPFHHIVFDCEAKEKPLPKPGEPKK